MCKVNLDENQNLDYTYVCSANNFVSNYEVLEIKKKCYINFEE